MKVLLVCNDSRPDALDAAVLLQTWLSREGIEAVQAVGDDQTALDAPVACDLSGVGLVVSLGGDGTLLRAAHIVRYSEIPILGLSFGHLGFLTYSGTDGVIASVAAALAGELHQSRRATLEVTTDFCAPVGARAKKSAPVQESAPVQASTPAQTSAPAQASAPVQEKHFALNEVALTRDSFGGLIEFDIAVSGSNIDKLRGDGFIVATATGSTAYALSAGGPIVTPEFSGMVCVPIAPHTILARAFLTGSSDIVELDVLLDRHPCVGVVVDGRPISEGYTVSHIDVRRGAGDIILLDAGRESFYRSVSRVFYGDGLYR